MTVAPKQRRSWRKFPPSRGRRGKPYRFQTVSRPFFISCLEPARHLAAAWFQWQVETTCLTYLWPIFSKSEKPPLGGGNGLILLPAPVPQKPIRKASLKLYKNFRLQCLGLHLASLVINIHHSLFVPKAKRRFLGQEPFQARRDWPGASRPRDDWA